MITCTFDKSSGSLIKKLQWFWIITRTMEYQVQDIIDIQVQEKRDRSIKGYRITLLCASGKNIHLTPYYTNYLKGRKKMNETANEIARFLGRRQIYF